MIRRASIFQPAFRRAALGFSVRAAVATKTLETPARPKICAPAGIVSAGGPDRRSLRTERSAPASESTAERLPALVGNSERFRRGGFESRHSEGRKIANKLSAAACAWAAKDQTRKERKCSPAAVLVPVVRVRSRLLLKTNLPFRPVRRAPTGSMQLSIMARNACVQYWRLC